MSVDIPQESGHATKTAVPIEPRDVELLSNDVAEKALEKITKRIRWPIILAAAFASYTGYNVWSDINRRIDAYQQKANEKLEQIASQANETLNKKLQEILVDRKTDLTELTTQLKKESAAAIVAAERARVESAKSADDIQKNASATIAQLETQLRAVQDRSRSVLVAIAIVETSISKRNRQLIKNDPERPAGGLQGQNALALIGLRQAIKEVGSGATVKVAVLSTGVTKFRPTPNGETLEDCVIEGKSFVPGEELEDKNGHGTWVTSLVAAIAPTARIVPVKVLSNRGDGMEANVLAGLDYAMSAGARIVILPLGSAAIPGKPPSMAYETAFKAMRDRGILVFVAAGNDGSIVGQPANCPHAIAVTSTSLNDTLSDFANRGPEIALAAPGEDILTVGLDGKYESFRGTSFAAPIAAGVAALILSVRPELKADEVATILRQSAKKLALESGIAGSGRVDALAAIQLAKQFKSDAN